MSGDKIYALRIGLGTVTKSKFENAQNFTNAGRYDINLEVEKSTYYYIKEENENSTEESEGESNTEIIKVKIYVNNIVNFQLLHMYRPL